MSRFGNSRDGRVVPMEVAQKLLDQRDRLADEYKQARQRIEQLEAARREDHEERQQLEQRAEEAEQDTRRLREKLAELEQQLAVEPDEEATRSADDDRDRLERRAARLQQDLERVRGRTEKSVDAARQNERIRLLSGLGEVLDAVDRALEMGDVEGPWRQGLEAIRQRFVSFLRAEGAEMTGKVGERMDPARHEAVATEAHPDFKKGEIVRVDRPGIVLDDGTVARSARVVVAA